MRKASFPICCDDSDQEGLQLSATDHATERLPHPPMLQAFPFNLALRLFMHSDIRATPEQLDAFRKFATVGDPLADDLVAEMRRLQAGHGRTLFEQAVEHGIAAVDDPPPALAAFFEQGYPGGAWTCGVWWQLLPLSGVVCLQAS